MFEVGVDDKNPCDYATLSSDLYTQYTNHKPYTINYILFLYLFYLLNSHNLPIFLFLCFKNPAKITDSKTVKQSKIR